MYKVKYRMKGISPYIQNNPVSNIEDVKTASTKTRIGKQENDPLKTGYRNEAGYYIPSRQIKGVMKEAGKKVKLGKVNISSFIKACVFFDAQESPMLKEGKPVKAPDFIYNEPIIKKNGDMVFNPRVAFREFWEADIEITVIEDVIPKAKIIEVLTVGGLYVGIGARRPEYGRFMVTEI